MDRTILKSVGVACGGIAALLLVVFSLLGSRGNIAVKGQVMSAGYSRTDVCNVVKDLCGDEKYEECNETIPLLGLNAPKMIQDAANNPNPTTLKDLLNK